MPTHMRTQIHQLIHTCTHICIHLYTVNYITYTGTRVPLPSHKHRGMDTAPPTQKQRGMGMPTPSHKHRGMGTLQSPTQTQGHRYLPILTNTSPPPHTHIIYICFSSLAPQFPPLPLLLFLFPHPCPSSLFILPHLSFSFASCRFLLPLSRPSHYTRIALLFSPFPFLFLFPLPIPFHFPFSPPNFSFITIFISRPLSHRGL